MEYEELKKQVNTKTFAKYINNLKEQGCIEVHEEFTSKVKEKYVRAVYLRSLGKKWFMILKQTRLRILSI